MNFGFRFERGQEYKEYSFAEITLSEMTREEFGAVREIVDRALESTMLDALGEIDGSGPPEDADFSAENFCRENSVTYKILHNGTLIGGAFLSFSPENQEGHLELFGLDPAFHGQGLGQRIWQHIEQIHSDIKVWELVTPTFALRNAKFYVNKCGFQIVEILKDSHDPKWDVFRFQKRLER